MDYQNNRAMRRDEGRTMRLRRRAANGEARRAEELETQRREEAYGDWHDGNGRTRTALIGHDYHLWYRHRNSLQVSREIASV